MKRFGFQLKLSLIFIVLVAAVLMTTTYFIYQAAVIQQKEQLQSKLLDLAKLSSMLIDGDRHSQIVPQMESQGSAVYKEIRGVLKKIRDSDPLIDSIYTMVRTETEKVWMFVVDSGDRKRRIAYCGERYDVSGMADMQRAFDGPSVDREPVGDKWGVWLSGYAPIYNRQGQAVAIIGIDISADSIRRIRLLLAKRFLLILTFGIMLALSLGWIVSRGLTFPLRSLTAGVREAGRGNFQHKVKIKSKDEIGELAGAFNKMMDGLTQAQAKLQHHYLDTIRSLAKALEAKDRYTVGHSERVAGYAVGIACHLRLSKEEIKLLEDLCILHDIGKIGVPEGVLGKPDALSEGEWRQVKMHPEIGESILKNIELLKPGLSIVSSHHERPDGKGYPNALKSNEISLLASIVAVADAFDAMTSDRPYRKKFSEEEAISVIKENAGSQFDCRVAEAFVDYMKSERRA